VRSDPYGHRAYLHPRVYRDLVTHVVLLGAPSTGKSSLAETLAREFHTLWMPEYGREYWDTHQVERRLSPQQLVEIANGHLEREETLLQQANGYLFTDTNALTTRIFAMYYHGSAAPRLEELADLAAGRYDLVFLCGDDIPYDDSWDRSGDGNRQVFQKQIVADLLVRKIPFFTLSGSLEQRVHQVSAVLRNHHKYQNLAESFQPKKLTG
jgi:HTH-type transcriptional repressor of NAD biosynthesis genes